ncbi:MAG: zinc-ribbon domain-containing protein [Clostridia bacterium]|nr:zinc-ribbon domain-containing protein [Clostridia bacterium]
MAEKKAKRYVIDDARLIAEWDWEKNNALGNYPDKTTVGSERKVFWKCHKGHEWQAVCYSRNSGNQCPVCSGRQVLAGYNDLYTLLPDIAQQWHPIKNAGITARDVTINSHRKVWWLGTCGHEWQAAVSERTRGRGCPTCNSKNVVAGINDLATNFPHIAKEWHFSKNDIKPAQVLPKSNKPFWWICSKGHEYKTSPAHRTSRGSSCPYCSNKQILIGFNDLATTHPEIASQWHPTKNKLTPQQVTIGAEKNIWWVCEKGHEWKALVYSRKHNGCPYCSGNLVLLGYNDLHTTHPNLAAQWHPTKNNRLTAFDVSAGSNQKVWWLGECGHEWQAVICSRASGCGCTACNEERKTSFAENAIFFYLKSIYPDTIKTYKAPWLGRMELDIYIPSLQVAIEYDGQAWHDNIEKDTRKGLLCQEQAIRLIRIREPNCPELKCESIKLKSTSTTELEQAILTLFKNFLFVSDSVDIDIERDRPQIYDIITHTQKSKSLAKLAPDIAKEWHPTLNGALTPENVSYKSNKKVWWKCQACGHEWQATVNHRSSRRGCPECAKQKRKNKKYDKKLPR